MMRWVVVASMVVAAGGCSKDPEPKTAKSEPKAPETKPDEAKHSESPPTPEGSLPRIRIGKVEGVRMPEDSTVENTPSGRPPEGRWTPSNKEIEAFEASFGPYLANELEKHKNRDWVYTQEQFKRQYSGVIIDGVELIHVELFCDATAGWDKGSVTVFDGGVCFSRALWDPAKKQVTWFDSNGEA